MANDPTRTQSSTSGSARSEQPGNESARGQSTDQSARSQQSVNQSNQSRSATVIPQRRSQGTGLARRGFDVWGGSPIATLFRRWNDEMDRFFEDFGFGRSALAPRGERPAAIDWAPQIEVFQRGDELVMRAELPGIDPADVRVDVADDVVTISGERKQENEEEREGWYRCERTYGSFYRAIPLPEGTITDSAKAEFKNGVLEIVLQAPPREVSRGRRLEIQTGKQSK